VEGTRRRRVLPRVGRYHASAKALAPVLREAHAPITARRVQRVGDERGGREAKAL